MSVIGFDQLSLFDLTILRQSLCPRIFDRGGEGGDKRGEAGPLSKYGSCWEKKTAMDARKSK